MFLLALSISVAFLFAVEGGLKPFPKTSLPFYFYLGGVFVVFYVLSVTWGAPRFGVGNAVAFVLLGQIISMAAIDQFGLLGASRHAITLQRSIGLILMSVGVGRAVRRGQIAPGAQLSASCFALKGFATHGIHTTGGNQP